MTEFAQNLDADAADAVVAAVELIGRAGAAGFEFGYLDKQAVRVEDANWYAQATYRGTLFFVDRQPGPVEAAEALAARIVHGAKCLGCTKLIAINDDPVPIPATLLDGTKLDPDDARRRGLCHWSRAGRRWQRGCGENAPAGSTREKLARALAEAGAPSEAIRLARSGHYDDFLSPLPFPINELVADLHKNGLHELAERAKAGEFDATTEESDAWAASEDGQATFGELFGDLERAAAARQATEGPGQQGRSDARPPWRANRRRGKKKKR